MLTVTLILITLTIVVFKASSSFRYYCKFAIYVLVFSVQCVLVIPFAIWRPHNVDNIKFGVHVARLVSPIIGIKWEIHGQEHLEKDFSAMVIFNHQSILDILAVSELWPAMKRFACVSKRELLYVFPVGFTFWLVGTIFIDRKNASSCYRMLEDETKKITNNKTKMIMFPEGTRNKTSELLSFKTGSFQIAVQNKLPIVPVVVSPYTFINDEKRIFNSGKVIISVLPPIETENLKIEIPQLIKETRNLMNEEFQRLTKIVRLEAGLTIN